LTTTEAFHKIPLTLKQEDKYASFAPILLGVAHEFRNPMQGIMASLAVLRSRLEEDEGAKPFLDMIQKNNSRINDLINQLLELTHPIQMDPEPHSIPRLVEEAINGVEDERRVRNGVIRLTSKKSSASSRADGQMLSKAFSALLENAVESRDANPHVEILVKGDDQELTVTIRDDGDGIQEKDLPRIFEPFFSTRPRKAGLGLCLADRIIHAHGGKIHVNSNQKNGTEVTVRLPVIL